MFTWVFRFFTAFDLKNEYLFSGRVLIADSEPGTIFHYDVILRLHRVIVYLVYRFFLIFHKLQTLDEHNLRLSTPNRR